MTFHPAHMQAGIQAAIDSPNTPSHLKPHLQARLGDTMKPKLPVKQSGPAMGGIMPKKNAALMPVVGKAPKAKKFGKGSPVAAVDNTKPLLPAAFYGR